MYSDLKTLPSVYAVGNEYQIMFVASCEMLVWAEVNGEEYYDESNGIIRSGKLVHRVTVPMEELDKSKKYTICYRKVIQRRPYKTETEDVKKIPFEFKPVENENIRMFYLADTHNKIETPIKAFENYGEVDLLVLNGDMPDHSNVIENFDAIHEIAGRITKGKIPVVFSRGNHDLRGIHAEDFADYTPTRNGYSYFSFRVGCLWGLVLDCGEDKPDDHPEYGNTVCCSFFRKKETKYIEEIVKNEEYNAEGITKRMVVCHVPFTETYREPFNIEIDTYSYWCKLLRENIKPQIMFCAHNHETVVRYPGDRRDNKGQACPVIHGASPCLKLQREEGIDRYIGSGIVFNNEFVEVTIIDNENTIHNVERFNI